MKYSQTITLETEECCNCGMVFAMPADVARRRREDHKTFYCPAGHGQHYTGKTAEQKLREKLEAEEKRRVAAEERALGAKAQAEKTVKAYKKIRDRVKNGVCPCCNRTFQNLLEHMKKQHPEFGTRDMLRPIREMFGLTQAQLAEEVGTNPAQISNYERGRPVPATVDQSIDRWIVENAG